MYYWVCQFGGVYFYRGKVNVFHETVGVNCPLLSPVIWRLFSAMVVSMPLTPVHLWPLRVLIG